MRNSNILVCGYFGYSNAGDELILRSLIKGIKKRADNASFYVMSAGRGGKTCGFVREINRWNLVSVLKAMFKCGTMACAGGLYQDVTGSPSLYYYLTMILLAKVFRMKILLCGVDIGPVSKKINRNITGFIMNFADVILVRTDGSLKLIGQLAGEKAAVKTKVTADLLFSEAPEIRQSAGCAKRARKTGVILRPSGDEKCMQKAIAFCESVADRTAAELELIPFHIENDIGYMRGVLKGLKGSANIARWNKPEDLFRILAGCDLIISQRLHGLILSSILAIPAVGIHTDSKLVFFMQEINRPDHIFEDFDSPGLHDAIDKLLRSGREPAGSTDPVLERLVFRANNGFQLIKEAMAS